MALKRSSRALMALKVSPGIVPLVGTDDPSINDNVSGYRPSVGRFPPTVVTRGFGFTLIELVVTLAVVAILTLVAAPSFREVIQNNRIAGLTNELLSDVNYARTEALKRATNVGICPSASGTSCDTGTDWQGGYIVFSDANGDGAITAPTDVVLRAHERFDSNTLTSATNPIVFGPRGLPMSAPGYTSYWLAPVSFSLCDDRGASKGRSITIDITGRASSSPNPGSC